MSHLYYSHGNERGGVSKGGGNQGVLSRRPNFLLFKWIYTYMIHTYIIIPNEHNTWTSTDFNILMLISYERFCDMPTNSFLWNIFWRISILFYNLSCIIYQINRFLENKTQHNFVSSMFYNFTETGAPKMFSPLPPSPIKG